MKIEIKGQAFDIHPDILKGILSAMNQTTEDGLEHGFLGCESPKGIVKGQDCTGNACSILLKGCEDIGPTAMNFHSHPEVISFSLGDYLHSLERAIDHPEKKQLMCVALKDAGIRCKAVTKIPPKNFSIKMIDTEENRKKVKPFFTEKVSISKKQLEELLTGTPWDKLLPEETVMAIDEGDVVVPKEAVENMCNMGGKSMPKKSLVEVAQQYINEPTGKYPWETKTVTKSVTLEDGGVGLELAGMPTLESDETQFIATRDIEVPDPKKIHYGEVGQYITAISPIILTKEKNEVGKWKILDGRHRLAAWRAAGYKQVPVVFSTENEYKGA